MRVKITTPATVDLCEIEKYISENNIAAAVRVINKLEESCLLLGDNPGIGRRRDYLKPKLRTITEGNYLICYRVRRNSVEVLRILHSARNIEKILRSNERTSD